MHISWCMGSTLCQKFQRPTLKFCTKFRTHTLQNKHFIVFYFCMSCELQYIWIVKTQALVRRAPDYLYVWFDINDTCANIINKLAAWYSGVDIGICFRIQWYVEIKPNILTKGNSQQDGSNCTTYTNAIWYDHLPLTQVALENHKTFMHKMQYR